MLIDVHKKSVSVCVLPAAGSRGPVKEEKFRTFTRDLKRLRAWLIACKVTEVAMKSTGQYWRPVWKILEGAVPKMLLLNPAHVKGIAGRKTDRLDAQWLATRLEREDLRGSFIPPRQVRELRDLTRLRAHWLEDLNRIKNRIGDVCETGNIKVSSVASDLFGVSGRKMLQVVVEGRRDAGWMADYARGTLRGKKGQLELALQGTFSEHQRGHLRSVLKQMQRLEQEVAELEAQIEQRVAVHEDLMRRLDGIPGIDRIAAWTILGEIGFDMSVFEDARHLASWAGVCPGIRESGGKRMSGRTRKGNMYLRRILCQCAWAAAHTKGSRFAAVYRRLRSRRGHQKAIMAVAHQLLVIVYHLLRDKTEYIEAGEEYLDHRNRLRAAARLIRKLRRLSIDIDPMILSQAAAAIAPAAPPTDAQPAVPQVKRNADVPASPPNAAFPVRTAEFRSDQRIQQKFSMPARLQPPKLLIQYGVSPESFS
jgi:transposase